MAERPVLGKKKSFYRAVAIEGTEQIPMGAQLEARKVGYFKVNITGKSNDWSDEKTVWGISAKKALGLFAGKPGVEIGKKYKMLEAPIEVKQGLFGMRQGTDLKVETLAEFNRKHEVTLFKNGEKNTVTEVHTGYHRGGEALRVAVEEENIGDHAVFEAVEAKQESQPVEKVLVNA